MKKIMIFVLLAVMASVMVAPIAGQDAVLTIWVDEARNEPLTALGEQFEAEQGIALEIVELPFGEIRDQFTTAAPAGEGPDIIIGAHDWLGELVTNGLLLPVDLGDKAELFVPAAVNAFNYEGSVYGMPYALENVALYYNTDLVPEAPTSWDEVRAISEELVANGDSQYGWVIQENDPYHFFGVQTAFGGYVFGFSPETGYDPSDVGIDNEGSIAAYDFLSSYVADGLMPAGLDADGMRTLFETGEAAMVISGPWDLVRFQDSGIPFAIAPIPGEGDVAQGSPFLGVQGFMVSAFSENSTLATLFLTEYIATDEVMSTLFEADPRPSAFISVAEGVDDENLAAFGAAGSTGLAMPAIPQMSAVWGSWGGAMEQVIQGRADGETAATDAATQIREAIASAG
ncbi:MAG: sugar ABC transporter substrate-binding protein [Phototrophicaceae bacterium]|jgi:maltose/maltodextrin transport system substrate-binding protein/arabinogalactan oligomer/maltooligosaccharide transport system substrate-binding protein